MHGRRERLSDPVLHASDGPKRFAAGIVVFSAPNDHSLGANTSYTLVFGSPGEQTLRLDATRSADQDSAETRREAGLPDPAAAAFEVRLTGPDHPVLVAVEPVSSPASVDDGVTPAQSVYGEEETVEIALRFDEPVTVTGAPTLALSIGTETRTATYAPGPRTLVFAYAVVEADADADGIDVGRVADAVTLGAGVSIVSVRSGLDAAYGELDPEPFADHPVNGGCRIGHCRRCPCAARRSARRTGRSR